jgi:hypothetical protein
MHCRIFLTGRNMDVKALFNIEYENSVGSNIGALGVM